MARCDNKHSRPQPPCYVCAVIYDPLCLQNNTWSWGPPGPARGCPSAASPGGLRPGAERTPALIHSPGCAGARPGWERGRNRGREEGREAGGEAGKQEERQESRSRGREAGAEAGNEAGKQKQARRLLAARRAPGAQGRSRTSSSAPSVRAHAQSPLSREPRHCLLPEKNHC